MAGEIEADTIELPEAVSEIYQACNEASETAERSPFFFVVGAGISYPAVPLASAIIDHCKDVVARYHREASPQGQASLDVYSYWFGLAYRQPRLRQQYLRRLIEDRPISQANLRLAHLLSARRLTNLVVTTNFDNLLTRALLLFGDPPAVCDHPRTVGRIAPDSPDIQIVHVHGSYLFYDCANLRGEVTGRAGGDDLSSLTTAGLLDSILWSRSPLVVGYSGWEGDVVMTALKRRIQGGHPLGQNIYWFCFSRDEIARLPAFLRQCAQVRFVVPPPIAAEAKLSEKRLSGSTTASAASVLSAREVFEALNRTFAAELPAIFEDPVSYFANYLEKMLPPEEEVPSERDPYSFKPLIARLRASAGEVHQPPRRRRHDLSLEELRSAVRQSRYEEALGLCSKLIPDRLSDLRPEERKEVLDAAAIIGKALLDDCSKRSAEVIRDLASVLSVDQDLDSTLGNPRPGLVVVTGSRRGHSGYEISAAGAKRGNFTVALEEALLAPSSTNLREAVLLASRTTLQSDTPQAAAISGAAEAARIFVGPRAGRRSRLSTRLFAVLIGVGEYAVKDYRLNGPPADVAAMDRLLRNPRRLAGAYLPTLLLDRNAKLKTIRAAIEKLAKAAQPEDQILFYYSGHAFWTEEGSNGQPTLMVSSYEVGYGGNEGTAPLADLLAPLRDSRAKQVVAILDY